MYVSNFTTQALRSGLGGGFVDAAVNLTPFGPLFLAQPGSGGVYVNGDRKLQIWGSNFRRRQQLGGSQIYGRRAGCHAASVAAAAPVPRKATIAEALRSIEELIAGHGTEPIGAVRSRAERLAWENMLVHVNEQLLETALRGFKQTRLAP